MDIIVLCTDKACFHDNLVLKAIRGGSKASGTLHECDASVNYMNNPGKTSKIHFLARNDGLRDVFIKDAELHAGHVYVARIDYSVPLGESGNSEMMFSGAIQPSDYAILSQRLNLPGAVNAEKIIEVVISSKHAFSAWFFDPQEKNYFPSRMPAKHSNQTSQFKVRKEFPHKMSVGDLRARYFSFFASLEKYETEKHGFHEIEGQSLWGDDDAPIGIGA